MPCFSTREWILSLFSYQFAFWKDNKINVGKNNSDMIIVIQILKITHVANCCIFCGGFNHSVDFTSHKTRTSFTILIADIRCFSDYCSPLPRLCITFSVEEMAALEGRIFSIPSLVSSFPFPYSTFPRHHLLPPKISQARVGNLNQP